MSKCQNTYFKASKVNFLFKKKSNTAAGRQRIRKMKYSECHYMEEHWIHVPFNIFYSTCMMSFLKQMSAISLTFAFVSFDTVKTCQKRYKKTEKNRTENV